MAAGIVAGGCGGKSTAGPEAPVAAAASAPRATKRVPGPSRLARRDVLSVLSAGLGAFLSRIEVERSMAGGRFYGWRIVALHWENTAMAGVDLRPGDVVTSVNGRPIERPEQALVCWQSLAVASDLRVLYERGSEKRELFYPIDEEPAPAK